MGTITASGVYTAPATVPSSGSATITATSTQDATKSGTATVTVTAPVTITSISVVCSPVSIQTNQTSTCTATMQGTGSFSSLVSWSVSPTSMGSISSTGVFTPAATGTATIVATSSQDTTKSGSTTVTVNTQQPTPTTPMVVPSILVSGQQTQVTVTSFVRGSDTGTRVQLYSLAGGSPTLIGNMTDNGQNGDQTAGDQVYTIVTTLTPPAATSLPMQVVATEGTASRLNVNFSVQLAQIPTYATNADVNQAESQIYNTAIQTRTSLTNPDWTNTSLLPNLSTNLVSMFSQLAGVVNQNPGLQSAVSQRSQNGAMTAQADSPRPEGIFQSIVNFFFPVIGFGQSTNSCSHLLDSLSGFPGATPSSFTPVPIDSPIMKEFAQTLTTACTTDPQCSYGLFSKDDFLTNTSNAYIAFLWAEGYIGGLKSLPTPIAGCSGGVQSSAENFAVTSEVGQFTGLAGSGLADAVGGGEIAQQIAGQANDILVGGMVDNSGNSKVVIGQMTPSQTIAAPAGTYNLAVSFGGDTANATLTNTPVYPSSTTNISPSPGATITVTPPYVTGLTPAIGTAGTAVVVTGTGFDPTASNNEVTFNGTSAQVDSSTTASIQTSVPAGASSGPVSVTTSSGSTTSSLLFMVTGSSGNPPPTITSLFPNTATAGATSQLLTINGMGFVLSSTVTFNGVAHQTTFVGTNRLTIILSAADLSTAGSYSIIVTNPAPGGGSANATFTVAALGVSVSPSSATVPVGAVQTFAATVSGGGSVTWSVQEGAAGGSITSAGIYTAPTATGTYHVVATNSVNSAQTATATVTVVAATAYAVLYSFPYAFESASLIQATDGNFYGTNEMIAYKIDSSGNFTQLVQLSSSPDAPISPLIQASDGDFYGTLSIIGNNNTGEIFKMDAVGNVTVLHSFLFPGFGSTDGAWPWAALTQGRDGNFYGTTYAGGNTACVTNGYGVAAYGPFDYNPDINSIGTGCGTIFRLDSSGNETVLHAFSGASDGSYPQASLIQGTDENFYGTTSAGGTDGYGTVFKIDAAGNFTLLHSFSSTDGDSPVAAVVQGADGYLYGTAASEYCFAPSCGEVFKIDTSGNNFTILHTFSGPDGYFPVASLIQGSDGSFYGTTWAGGDLKCGSWYYNVGSNYPYPDESGCGTVFKMDSAGNATVLHDFEEPQTGDGNAPYAGLILGKDGHLYGTTYYGGASIYFGTIFRVSVP